MAAASEQNCGSQVSARSIAAICSTLGWPKQRLMTGSLARMEGPGDGPPAVARAVLRRALTLDVACHMLHAVNRP